MVFLLKIKAIMAIV